MNILHRAHVLYRFHRRALHRRLVASMRAKPYSPRIYVGKPEVEFDERSSIDRFRRETGR